MKLPLLALAFALTAATGLRATTVYTTDFTGTNGTTPSGWTTVSGLTISGNNYVADGVNNLASIYDDGLGASGIAGLGAYTVTSTFQTSSTASGQNVGLIAFSDSSAGNYYLGRARTTSANVWALEIYKFNTTGVLINTTAVNVTLASNTSFVLQFAVDAVADTQTFSVLSSASGTVLGSVSATDSALSGGRAGVRMADATAVLTYEDFTVSTSAIPEPATTAFLGGLGVLGLALGCRRRKAAK